MNPYLIIAFILALIGVGAAAEFDGQKRGKDSERVVWQARENTELVAANLALQAMTKERDAKAERLSGIDKDYTNQLTKARNENKTLSARIASGSIGLRIAATCKSPFTGTETAKSGSMDTPASAVLDPAAGQTYSALRDNITTTETTLEACQKSLAQFQ